MEEKKIKKKKLTLTVSTKKPYNIPHYKTFSQKKSVVIEKKISRKKNEKKFYGQASSSTGFVDKQKFKKTNDSISKNPPINRNFEIRKIAEEKATKRFKNLKDNNLQQKKSNLGKNKGFVSKREYKKAKEFYMQILTIRNLQKELYDHANLQLASINLK